MYAQGSYTLYLTMYEPSFLFNTVVQIRQGFFAFVAPSITIWKASFKDVVTLKAHMYILESFSTDKFKVYLTLCIFTGSTKKYLAGITNLFGVNPGPHTLLNFGLTSISECILFIKKQMT